MTPDKRTLTDELNSVLIAHSLDAPEPARTIEQVLERVANQKPVRVRPNWLRAPRHLNSFIGAAVVIGLLFAAAVALRPHSEDSKSAASSAAAGSGSSAKAGVGAAASAVENGPINDGGADSPGLAFCSPVGAQISGLQFGNQSPNVVELSCPASAASLPAAQSLVAPSAAPSQTGAYGSSLTITPDNDVAPNQVTVFGHATLIDPSQNLQVQSVTAAGHTVTVKALDASGNLHELTFTSNDGQSFTKASDTTIAKACTLGDLSVTLTKPATVRAGTLVGLITVVNTSGGAGCALSGYPEIQAAAAEIPSAKVIDAADVLAGPAGGIRKTTSAPIFVLASGQQASAIIESSAKTSLPCASTGILTISLPQIGVVRDYANFPLGLCNLDVHPLVSGSSGSD